VKTKTRDIKGTGPRYRNRIDRDKGLSELIREDEMKATKEEKKKKVVKPEKRKLVSCADCEHFVFTEVRDGKTYGKFNCAGKCTHL
jgi:hypothetical protein